ncbi:MAG: pyrimidine/purine nucleoside phosphorylase [Chromatiales bacterium]|nr:pyrimidine/purine nucleoside phosphorylase [Chromatiales bacterium]
MNHFENVTVIRSANIYFDGKVTSRTVQFADGGVKTLGVMLPGEYEFNTGKAELMEIQSGSARILLPQETEWRSVEGGESFNVPANSSFKITVASVVDYCCSFLDD